MPIDEKQPAENENATSVPEAPAATSDTAQTPRHAHPDPSVQSAPKPRRRGFAAMDRDRVKQIASKGGRAAHAAGTAHQFSSDEARVAGKKGGMAPHVRRGGTRRRTPTALSTPATDVQTGQTRGPDHGDQR